MKHHIQNLFDQGKSQAEICRLTGKPRSTVSRWIKEKAVFSDFQRMRKKNTKVIDKIQSRYIPEPNSGCWIWMGNIKKNGYGSLTVGKKNMYAHRLSYETYVGNIPDKMVLDHKCRTRCCCNPNHLEAVTQKENCRRGKRWKKEGNL
jgi:predicted transcriptional regulator